MKQIKYLTAIILFYTGILSLIKKLFVHRAGEKGFVALLYHRVVEEDKRTGSMPEMIVSPEMFEAQMAYLARYYMPLSLDDYLNGVTDAGRSAPKVIVTFDDGWRDNYFNAYGILRKYRIPAVIFLTTGYIGNDKVFWPERLAGLLAPVLDGRHNESARGRAVELITNLLSQKGAGSISPPSPPGESQTIFIKHLIEKLKPLNTADIEAFISEINALVPGEGFTDSQERQLLSWEEVETMKAGGISFGSHTRDHTILSQAERELVEQELIESKLEIENRTKTNVAAFAFPNGNYNSTSLDATASAGYKVAFTTEFGLNNKKTSPLKLKRIRVDDSFSKGPGGGFSKCLFEFGIWRHAFSGW